MVTPEFKANLLERVDIVSLIAAHVELKPRGSNYLGLCPFHNEKTASFSVNSSRQFYYCFGCGAKGDAIQFLMDYFSLSFVDALRELCQKAGVHFPEEQSLNLDMRTGWTREQELWIDIFFWTAQILDIYSTYRGVQYDCVYEANPLLDEVPKVHEMIGLKMAVIGGIDTAFQYDEEFFTGWKLFSGITTSVIVANNFRILEKAQRRCDKR